MLPTRALFERTAQLAIELDHPAYDCLYLALALENDCRFVTADERFARKVGQAGRERLRDRVVALTESEA